VWRINEINVSASGEDFSCSATDPLLEVTERRLIQGQHFRKILFALSLTPDDIS
jgi:hypothetical protein